MRGGRGEVGYKVGNSDIECFWAISDGEQY